ncbi:unnamed protein product [Meloidogyne enterolobii]|uniref:Uncharacterized protein n=1 Tax=Meloidogyne enterolobii TaxID=390850 RepID=A0ACB0YDE4_MELEN
MLTAILQQSQQTGSTSAKGAFRDNSLQRSPPPPPPPKKKEVSQSNIEDQQQLITKTEIEEIELKPATNTGGFNINQMLEQITKQNSPPPPQPPIAITNIKREETNTLDLLANVELSDSTTNIVEESPASPVFASEQQQENEDKPAALIPVVREWKLHLVDLSPLTECSDMHFDIKLQISSSNSDPRLRKIAEKQFDLVSKTLEQQQANQQKNNFNEGIFTPTEQIKKEIEKREAIGDVNYETGLQDPRTKDPRRKREISGISSTSSLDEAELVKKQMAALEAAAKQQQNCEQSSQLFSTQLGIRQQLGLPPPNINFQLPPPPAFLPGNSMGNQFFTVPPPPPPFPLQQQQQLPQNFSTPPPSTYQQINQIVTSSHQNLEAQTFNTEQLPCSSSIDPSKSSNSPFEKIHSETSSFPSYQYSRGYFGNNEPDRPYFLPKFFFYIFTEWSDFYLSSIPIFLSSFQGGYRGRRGRYSTNYHHHHHQQHYREYNQQNIRRSESPPKQQQQEENVSTSSTISLREKRKNNEYESPLARMANNRY